MITKKNYNVDLAKISDKEVLYEFAKEMFFDEIALGNKSTRDKSLLRLLKPPGIMVSPSGVSSPHKKKLLSKTIILSSDPNELCDRLKLLLR